MIKKIALFLLLTLYFISSYSQTKIDSLKSKFFNNSELTLTQYESLSDYFISNRKTDSLKFFFKKYHKKANLLHDQKHKLLTELIRSEILNNENKNDSAIILIKSIYKKLNKFPNLEYKANNFLSFNYRELSKLDSAEYYGFKSYKIAKKEKNRKKTITSLVNLYKINAKDDFNISKSLSYVDSIFNYTKSIKNNYSNPIFGGIYHQLGNFSIRLNDYKKAKYFYFESRKYYFNKVNNSINLFL